MQFFTLKQYNTNFKDFIKFWSQFYQNDNTHLYKKYINQEQLTPEELEEFCKWRNVSENLNQDKQAVFDQVKENINLLNEFKNQEKLNVKKFVDAFDFVRHIWKFYLLHWCAPTEFPVFDENTYKAQRMIQFQIYEDHLPYQDRYVEKYYFNHYKPDFYDKLQRQELDELKIYEALYVYGEFLSKLLE